MTSTRPCRSSFSRSSVHRDFPVEARACRFVVLFVSPREVEVGYVVVERVGWDVWRKLVKRVTWARARAEERVPMRRGGGCGVEGERLAGGGLEVGMGCLGEGGERLC